MKRAVLISGGLDSAILLGTSLPCFTEVHPLFVRQGLFWEGTELRYLRRFLDAMQTPALRSLHILEMPVADLYGRHWSVTGADVPGAETKDDAVFLPGRNVLLIAKAHLWCHVHEIGELALGILQSNPFPDATARFFANLENVLNQSVHGRVRLLRPFADRSKKEVMLMGQNLPLHLTFSCIQAVQERHCGRCNKCAERKHAFAAAELADPTEYAN